MTMLDERSLECHIGAHERCREVACQCGMCEHPARRTEAIIQAVDDATPGELRDLLDHSIVEVARSQATVFCDDVWAILPEERRASIGSRMGPAFRRAAIAGIIEKIPGEFREPVSAGRTHSVKQVWRSRIYRSGAE